MLRKHCSLFICIFAVCFPFVVAAIALIFFTGCATGTVYHQDVSKANFHDLDVEINDKSYRGFGVIPRSEKYKIGIKPKGNVTRLRIETCHMKKIFDKPDKDFWNGRVEYTHKVMAGLEDKQSCLMKITVLDHKKEENGYWIGDFLDTRPDVSGKAVVKCDGRAISYDKGASICQASINTYQGIEFETEHIYRTTDDCKGTMTTKDGLIYEFIPKPGLCIYYFNSNKKAENGRWIKHRLTVFGVTDYPFKEMD